MDDTYSTSEDETLQVDATGVLSNDVDPHVDTILAGAPGQVTYFAMTDRRTGASYLYSVADDPLSVLARSDAGHGTVILAADGSFEYVPDPNFHGVDEFTYELTDGTATDTARVTIDVASVNDPPVAVMDSFTALEDTPLPIGADDLLANDYDVDGDALTIVQASSSAHGTLATQPDGSYLYTPAPDFYGLDSFIYTVSDGKGGTSATQARIIVEEVDPPPIAYDDSVSTDEDTDLPISAGTCWRTTWTSRAIPSQ